MPELDIIEATHVINHPEAYTVNQLIEAELFIVEYLKTTQPITKEITNGTARR